MGKGELDKAKEITAREEGFRGLGGGGHGKMKTGER